MRLLSWLGMSSSRPVIEQWATKVAPMCSPDELLAAACIESFAKDFSDWTSNESRSHGFMPGIERLKYHLPDSAPILCNVKRDITLKFIRGESREATSADKRAAKKRGQYVDSSYAAYVNSVDGCTLNNVLLDKAVTARLIDAWTKAVTAHKAAAEAAAKAREAMELNEKKWDLAESLFGLKRTPEGALVASTCQHSCGGNECQDVSCAGSHSLRPEQD